MSTNPGSYQGNGKRDSHVVRPNYRDLGTCNWSDIPIELCHDLITVCTRAGAAVMFGVTSDGGALSLCILSDADKIKEYPRTEAEVLSLLVWLKNEYFKPRLVQKK